MKIINFSGLKIEVEDRKLYHRGKKILNRLGLSVYYHTCIILVCLINYPLECSDPYINFDKFCNQSEKLFNVINKQIKLLCLWLFAFHSLEAVKLQISVGVCFPKSDHISFLLLAFKSTCVALFKEQGEHLILRAQSGRQ